MERLENCTDSNYWQLRLHLSKCYSDPLTALCCLIGNRGRDWMFNAINAWTFNQYRWN